MNGLPPTMVLLYIHGSKPSATIYSMLRVRSSLFLRRREVNERLPIFRGASMLGSLRSGRDEADTGDAF